MGRAAPSRIAPVGGAFLKGRSTRVDRSFHRHGVPDSGFQTGRHRLVGVFHRPRGRHRPGDSPCGGHSDPVEPGLGVRPSGRQPGLRLGQPGLRREPDGFRHLHPVRARQPQLRRSADLHDHHRGERQRLLRVRPLHHQRRRDLQLGGGLRRRCRQQPVGPDSLRRSVGPGDGGQAHPGAQHLPHLGAAPDDGHGCPLQRLRPQRTDGDDDVQAVRAEQHDLCRHSPLHEREVRQRDRDVRLGAVRPSRSAPTSGS